MVIERQYPVPTSGPVYTGEILKVGPDSYLISVGVEGSEAPPFRGEFVESGPFTTKQGIADWLKAEKARIEELGGNVTFHFNNAAITRSALEEIVGKTGAEILLQPSASPTHHLNAPDLQKKG